MQTIPKYPEKINIVLDCEYDADKNVYTTEKIIENRKNKFRLNIFNRKNVKTR